MNTTPTRHSPNAVLMLGQRLRRRPNIKTTLEKCSMVERKSSCPANTTHLHNIYTTSAQRLLRWSNIVKSHTCLCLLSVNTSLGSASFDIPAVIQSVCLQTDDQVGARANLANTIPYLPAYKSHWSISRTRLKIRLEP